MLQLLLFLCCENVATLVWLVFIDSDITEDISTITWNILGNWLPIRMWSGISCL